MLYDDLLAACVHVHVLSDNNQKCVRICMQFHHHCFFFVPIELEGYDIIPLTISTVVVVVAVVINPLDIKTSRAWFIPEPME